MAYPVTPIQQSYSRYHEIGQEGQIAKRQNKVWYFDVANVDDGVASNMLPGKGTFLNSSGNWIIPADDTDAINNVTHILGFEKNDLNQFNVTVGNATQAIEYPAGSVGVKGLAEGSIFVKAGGDIVRDERIVYQVSTDQYIASAVTPFKLLIIALQDASIGDIFKARIHRVN